MSDMMLVGPKNMLLFDVTTKQATIAPTRGLKAGALNW